MAEAFAIAVPDAVIEMASGGHFPALEQSAASPADMRAFFGRGRRGSAPAGRTGFIDRFRNLR